MKYTIEDNNGESIAIQKQGIDVLVTLSLAGGDSDYYLTPEEFKEFRRAVGYVWQEMEDK